MSKQERKYLESQRLNYYSLAYRAHLEGDGAKCDLFRAAAKEIEARLGK